MTSIDVATHLKQIHQHNYMKLKVKDKEVELKYSFRSMMMYENIKGESFAPQTMTDTLLYMLCVILASDKTVQLTFDELVDMIDEDPNILVEFADWLGKSTRQEQFLAADSEVEVKPEKKS